MTDAEKIREAAAQVCERHADEREAFIKQQSGFYLQYEDQGHTMTQVRTARACADFIRALPLPAPEAAPAVPPCHCVEYWGSHHPQCPTRAAPPTEAERAVVEAAIREHGPKCRVDTCGLDGCALGSHIDHLLHLRAAAPQGETR